VAAVAGARAEYQARRWCLQTERAGPVARRHGETDVSAFRKSLEAAIPALRRYARALTRDAEAADDLVQDTLVRALRSEHPFHEGEVRRRI
jgi:DNA-directed RNA polymerase specialized sigma24 family protein